MRLPVNYLWHIHTCMHSRCFCTNHYSHHCTLIRVCWKQSSFFLVCLHSLCVFTLTLIQWFLSNSSLNWLWALNNWSLSKISNNSSSAITLDSVLHKHNLNLYGKHHELKICCYFFPCSCFYTNKCTQYQVPNKKMSPRRINQHSVLFHPTENIWLDQNIDYWLDQQSSVSSLSFKLVNYLNFSIESCLELCNALLFLFL